TAGAVRSPATAPAASKVNAAGNTDRRRNTPCSCSVSKFFSPVSRAGFSACPGRDLPGQLDGLLRTSLPGKTVTGQDPAGPDRLDLFQRGQGPVVILVQEPGEQLRAGLAVGQAERRQRVARDQDVT